MTSPVGPPDKDRKDKDPEEAPDTPPDEPTPPPVQDPPPDGQPDPPYVVESAAGDIASVRAE